MKINKAQVLKKMLAEALVAVMIVLSIMVIPPTSAKAATSPALNKLTRNILVGDEYDLNINNKVNQSTYVWSTSNKKIATVTQKGIVTGVNKGSATITCKMTTPKKTYSLTCKVKVVKPAKLVVIKNKVSTLYVGQEYDLNRKLIPSTSNDLTTWKSSDKSIAAPNALGKFTALKAGVVTITARTLSGATDTVTITVAEKAVTNQAELEQALLSSDSVLTIKTDDAVNFTIPSGTYKKKLIVDAPNSDVTNNGVFTAIDIKRIKSNTWYEMAIGNLLNVLSQDSRIVVDSKASVSIQVSEAGATLRVENNGKVLELVINKNSDVSIGGTSKQEVPVVINVPKITITSSVPLNLDCKEKMDLVLLPGAEATKVQATSKATIPDIQGAVSIKVVVGTGTDAKEETVVGTPIVTPTPTPGGGTVVTPSNPKAVMSVSGGAVIYTLPKSYKELKSVKVSYNAYGLNFTIDSTMLQSLKNFLSDDAAAVTQWKNTVHTTKSYLLSQTVTVDGTKGSPSKTVTFNLGNTIILTYKVTVINGTVEVKNLTTGSTYTMSKSGETILMISPKPADIEFELIY